MRNIAIIPARSGSKGLKDKNIKLLNGKPLIAYTIEAAKNSNLFDEIFVSTDSKQYADIARAWGANVPFLRDASLATDSSSTWDVVKDAILKYENKGNSFSTVALLQPTSPLRGVKDIVNAYDLFFHKKARAVVSVCETDHSPLWCNTLPEDHAMGKFINEELYGMPRQSLPTYYRLNGALYIVNVHHLMTSKRIYDDSCFAYIMEKEDSIDIDDALDFKIAEVLLKHRTEIQ